MPIEDGESTGPLHGLRIIDLTTYVAGPSGMMSLAQLGADVIRIDPIGGATDVRRLPLSPGGTSLYWVGLNKGKRSVEINLRSEEGQRIVAKLVRLPGQSNGVLVTNAVGQDWLSYEQMSQYRSDLIGVYITGRPDGSPAVDYTVNCEVGLPLITGPQETTRPVNHVLPAWDLLAGMHAANAVLAAVRRRDQTGQGQCVTVALSDVAVATVAHLGFLADVAVNGRERLRDGNYLYGSFGCDFPTSDGQRVMIVALTQRHWHKLIELTGIGGSISALEASLGIDFNVEEDRFRYRQVLEALIRPWFESRSYSEVTRSLDAAALLWGPYRTIEGLMSDPTSLLNTTTLMAEVDQPGVGRLPLPRPVSRFAETADDVPRAAPALGGDTNSVLSELLGFERAELDALRATGVIGR